MAILLVAIAPALKSLTGSSGRKATASLLLSSIERARAQAIKDARATYVAFPGIPASGANSITDQKIVSMYFYHSLAIFEDGDPNTVNAPKVQITPWKPFPTGISLRTEISYSAANSSSNASWSASDFFFTPDPTTGGKTQDFPCMKFDEAGNLIAPTAANATLPIRLRFFEGFVTNGTYEKPTTRTNKDEIIEIAPNSGRAKYVP
jgi:hypothetical protein